MEFINTLINKNSDLLEIGNQFEYRHNSNHLLIKGRRITGIPPVVTMLTGGWGGRRRHRHQTVLRDLWDRRRRQVVSLLLFSHRHPGRRDNCHLGRDNCHLGRDNCHLGRNNSNLRRDNGHLGRNDGHLG